MDLFRSKQHGREQRGTLGHGDNDDDDDDNSLAVIIDDEDNRDEELSDEFILENFSDDSVCPIDAKLSLLDILCDFDFDDDDDRLVLLLDRDLNGAGNEESVFRSFLN
nr:hypothetical protein Iba_scaffold150CG0860 [Ipomoea batatas]